MSDQPSEPDKPTDTPERDEPSARENREAALNALLDTYPALDDAQRRSAFLLGAAIGNLTQYQLKDGKSSVLLRNHSVNALSKHNLKRTLADVVHLNSVYSQENERVGSNLMYGELMERLPETFAAKDPSEWDLSTDDLRYHYALGIAFAQQHNQ